LGKEAELGLAGELSFLGILLDAGLKADEMIRAWVGPDDEPQDFLIGKGAIEVKATLSADSMRVRIGSLEQLDDSQFSPLFLTLIRFADDERGLTLPGLVADIAARLKNDQHILTLFRERIFTAGYHDSHDSQYTCRFFREDTRIYTVVTGFPRLITGLTTDGIMRAIYEIDLGHASTFETSLAMALNKTGVINNDA
ncbi:MAG: PD-(D/E)XK motif protein, partial [Methylococcaceae bacterium]